ncbi:hypothetical protein ABW21_db0202794 [Orbilia brochopaga]|nr:hypothetical protein ABW21_db0202794 [Drechslerella brochopaga]
MTRETEADFFTPEDLAPGITGDWQKILCAKATLGKTYPNTTSLWTRKNILFDKNGDSYRPLLPALRLATNIVLRFHEKFEIDTGREYEGTKDEIKKASREDFLDFVMKHLPDLAMDPDMERIDSCAYTQLAQNSGERNVVFLQFPLLKPLLLPDDVASYHQKVLASFYIATLILRELGHVLQCRSARRNDWSYIHSSSSPELRLFGGRFHPIYQPRFVQAEVKELRAVAMSSARWNFQYMEVTPQYMEQLLLPETWASETLPSISPPVREIFRTTIFIEHCSTWADYRILVEGKRRKEEEAAARKMHLAAMTLKPENQPIAPANVPSESLGAKIKRLIGLSA